MTLSTKFTREELDYLRGLPEVVIAEDVSDDDRIKIVRTSWARNESPSHLWRGCLDHAVFAHIIGEEEILRHGEALARLRYSGSDFLSPTEADGIRSWINSIHAYEEVA